jgi:hypothetical protein
MKRHRSSSHATTPSFNAKLLPKWAKIIPFRSRSDPVIVGACPGKNHTSRINSHELFDQNKFLDIQNEDDYLRTLTFYSIAQFLENHLQKLLQTSCSAMVCELLDRLLKNAKPSIVVVSNDVNDEQLSTSLHINNITESVLIPRMRNGDSLTHAESSETSLPTSVAPSTVKDSVLRNYTVQSNYVYDPLLLPVFLLNNGPFSMTDKLLIKSHVLHQIQKAEPRTCCISLPLSNNHPFPPGYHKSNVSLKEDFMNQCWNQEIEKLLCHSNDLLQKKGIYRQLKKIKATLSIAEQLVLWSSQSIYFDSIAIFWNIEHGSVMYNHHSNMLNSGKQSFEEFIQWCAERRLVDGIPISIILYNPKNGYRQSLPFYSSIQSMVGIRLHNIASLPDTTTMFNQFWKNIISDIVHGNHPTAILVYSACKSYATDFSGIFATFKLQDQSITSLIRSIEVLMSKYLSVPSNLKSFPSTVAVLCHRPIRSTNLLKRITSLLYDSGFLKYLLNHESPSNASSAETGSSLLFHEIEEYEVRCVLLSTILHIYGTVWDKYVHGTDHHQLHSTLMKPHSFLPFLFFDSHLSGLENDCKFDGILLKDEDRQFLVRLLFKYRSSIYCNHRPISTYIAVVAERRTISENIIVERILRIVNEMIVLFDHCISLQDLLCCIESSVMEVIQVNTNISYPTPLPRHDYVHALLASSKIIHGSKSTAFISIPGWLYEILHNRISITEVEWYQTFCQRYLDEIDDSPTTTNLFPLFACGIRHLQVSGLVRRSIGKNSIVQYERTGLVWCGGD